jgi:hypothetical protein
VPPDVLPDGTLGAPADPLTAAKTSRRVPEFGLTLIASIETPPFPALENAALPVALHVFPPSADFITPAP